MISCDTNILFVVCDADSPYNEKARAFLNEHARRDDFCLCEQVLMELYCLLRNPKACSSPLTSMDAVKVISGFRSNPHWRIVDHVPGHGIMDRVWDHATERSFAYRRIFDARLASVLVHHGVDEFATRNLSDFRDMGFHKVWDPFSTREDCI